MRLRVVALLVLGLAFAGCTADPKPAATAAPATRTAGAALPTTTPAAAAAAGAGLDGAAVFRAFVDAINRGDATAALALIAANATWERGGQCPPGQCVGLARLAQEVERDVANHHRMDIAALDGSADSVTVRIELRNDGTRRAGVERTIQTFAVAVADGKIVSLRATNDLTDPLTAEFAGPRARQ